MPLKIILSVLNLKTGKRTEVEEQGTHQKVVLMKFMAKAVKYANKDHKVLNVATDDLATYGALKGAYPEMNVNVIENYGENSGVLGEQSPE